MTHARNVTLLEPMSKRRDIVESSVRYYKVLCTDLTEGRGYSKEGIVMVHTTEKHKEFVENWCFDTYGSRVGFVMGNFHPNSLMSRWTIFNAFESNLPYYEVLAKIEDNSVDKLWDQ